jgi:hypothetical protein
MTIQHKLRETSDDEFRQATERATLRGRVVEALAEMRRVTCPPPPVSS